MKSLAYIVALAIAAVILVLGMLLVVKAVWHHDQASCRNWQQEAQARAPWTEFNPGGYYVSPGQKEQCDYWGIKVNAPVHQEE